MKKIVLIFLGLVLPLLVLARIEDPLRGIRFQELMEKIIAFLFNTAFALFPLMIVVAAFYFVTAGGNPGQIEKAKNILLYALVGFIIILLAKSFIEFLKKFL